MPPGPRPAAPALPGIAELNPHALVATVNPKTKTALRIVERLSVMIGSSVCLVARAPKRLGPKRGLPGDDHLTFAEGIATDQGCRRMSFG
jgi:hypothetical protein